MIAKRLILVRIARVLCNSALYALVLGSDSNLWQKVTPLQDIDSNKILA